MTAEPVYRSWPADSPIDPHGWCPPARPRTAIDVVVESVPRQLLRIVDRVRNGRLRTHIGTAATLDDAAPR